MPLHFAEPANQKQSLGLQLPDSLASDPEFFANLFQGGWLPHHPRAHPQDVSGPIV